MAKPEEQLIKDVQAANDVYTMLELESALARLKGFRSHS